jgi:hypothetical protein
LKARFLVEKRHSQNLIQGGIITENRQSYGVCPVVTQDNIGMQLTMLKKASGDENRENND